MKSIVFLGFLVFALFRCHVDERYSVEIQRFNIDIKGQNAVVGLLTGQRLVLDRIAEDKIGHQIE